MKHITTFRLSTFLLLFVILFISCEEDNETNLLTVPVKIVTANNEVTPSTNLLITSENPSNPEEQYPLSFNVEYNMLTSINIVDNGGSFYFYFRDRNLGVIEQRFTKEELLTYTLDNPLILEFGGHLAEEVYTITVDTQSNGKIDMVTRLFETTLYHVEWGDGEDDTMEAPMNESTFASDFLKHTYDNAGTYTITVRAARKDDVQGITLGSAVELRPAKVTAIQLNDLDNLEILSLGYNTIQSIDDVIAKLPMLKDLSLRFGVMTSIDLTNNTELEFLLLNSSRFEEIKGLQTLTKLQRLGLKIAFNNVNVSKFPELEFLYLSNNNIEIIDVSQNPKLEHINLGNNKLTSIDLSNNPEVSWLYLYDNNIESVDISNLEKLEVLSLSSAPLKTIDYPISLNYLERLNFSNCFQLGGSRGLLDLLYAGQENNPRESVSIAFPTSWGFSSEDMERLEALEANFNWSISY
ncbi:Leucine Rich repeats (2 copies) [Aquimarina amphilecti]|uniref:Leucine Rich repeats (2 copies) n=1 Tax=Aquimarina amphilecti TaxID=1038014 RepID=A0A1H7KFF4_AQUAM|nr:leucine-rich repeat domain-containing protein [Aquimarina amphilecti]SEK85613.1 Leucine Rich repeats (2 copies) [Aquimarina amphilecti]